MNRISVISLMVLLFLVLSGCGKEGDIKKIHHLEKRLSELTDPEKRSSLANLLHASYSLYHINYPNDTLFLMSWAKMAREGMEYKLAKDICNSYLSLVNNNAAVYRFRGEINATLGYFGEAASDFYEAAQLAQKEKLKAKYAGYVSLYNSVDSIVRVNNQQLTSDFYNPEPRLRRAGQFIRVGHFPSAKYDIDKALAIRKELPYAYYLNAKMARVTGDAEQALKELESYFSYAQSSDSLFSAALELRSDSDLRIKMKRAEAALQTEPLSYEKLVEAGTLAFSLKEYPASIRSFNRLIEVWPDSLLGYLYRAQAYIQTAETDKAMSDLDRALKINNKNISAHNLKAYLHLLRKEYQQLDNEIAIILELNGEPLEILKEYTVQKEATNQ